MAKVIARQPKRLVHKPDSAYVAFIHSKDSLPEFCAARGLDPDTFCEGLAAWRAENRRAAPHTPHMLSGLRPKAKGYTIHDAQCRGLAIRVQPTGARSWVTWQRTKGKSRRVTLGALTALSLDEARAALHHQSATGRVREAPNCPTFDRLVTAIQKNMHVGALILIAPC